MFLTGLAAIDIKRPSIELMQFRDNLTYSNTMRLINSYDASVILVPDTQSDSPLYTLIHDEFELVQLEPLRRKCV